VDRRLPFFCDPRAFWLWDVCGNPSRVATWCVPPLRCLKELSDVTPISKALVLPDLPFEEFRLCTFNRWRAGEITNTVLSLVYGMFRSLSLDIHVVATNHFAKDSLAFFIIVYSVKWRGPARPRAVPSLFDNIVQDATMYFLVIFSSHLVLIFFELFAPVSDFLIDPSPPPLLTSCCKKGNDSTPSCGVSHRLDRIGVNLTEFYLISSANAV